MGSNITRWSAVDEATLIRLMKEGNSATIIGIAMGKTRNAIMGGANRLHLKWNSKVCLKQTGRPRRGSNRIAASIRSDVARFTAQEDQVIREMAAAGKSGSDIAEALGRNKSSIVQRARRVGAKLNGKLGRKEPRAPAAKTDLAVRNEPIAETRHVTPRVAVEPLMVALVDLRPGMCRYPVGDPLREPFGFCGHPMDATGSYCRPHARLCYTAPEARRRAA